MVDTIKDPLEIHRDGWEMKTAQLWGLYPGNLYYIYISENYETIHYNYIESLQENENELNKKLRIYGKGVVHDKKT